MSPRKKKTPPVREEVEQEILPAPPTDDDGLDDSKSTALVTVSSPGQLPATSLDRYLAEVSRFPLLTREEEYELAMRYYEKGDMEAAHKLVTANLRFVVKIAMQYSKYGLKLTDLIQEGNVGLMMAVKKFDPTRGFKLISYAVYWIRAYIQKHLLDSWSLVRLGTTQAQRKLFNSMKRVQRKIRSLEGEEASDERLANVLEVREEDVREMRGRIAGRDLSLDTPLDYDGGATRMDFLASDTENVEDYLGRESNKKLVQKAIKSLVKTLNNKELEILHKRLLADDPVTLQNIGDKFSISRERVRQIEQSLKKKIKNSIEGLLEEGEVIDVE
jgi:RNA polymerase sigma-32 factor